MCKVHFDGLAKEVGNEPLHEFYKYITTEGDFKFKILIFKRELFILMLNNIFTKYRENNSMKRIKKPDDLKKLLIANGVTDNTNRAYTNYVYGVPNSLDSIFTIVVVKFSFFASFFLLLISVEKWIS